MTDMCHAVRTRNRNRDVSQTKPAAFERQNQQENKCHAYLGKAGSAFESDREEEPDQQDVLEPKQRACEFGSSGMVGLREPDQQCTQVGFKPYLGEGFGANCNRQG